MDLDCIPQWTFVNEEVNKENNKTETQILNLQLMDCAIKSVTVVSVLQSRKRHIRIYDVGWLNVCLFVRGILDIIHDSHIFAKTNLLVINCL